MAASLLAGAAIFGAGAVSIVLSLWSTAIRSVSATILIGLGDRTILRARSIAKPARAVTMRVAYVYALMLTLTNPMTIIPYLALATVAADGDIGSSTLSLWSVPGVMMAATAWYASLSSVTALMRRP